MPDSARTSAAPRTRRDEPFRVHMPVDVRSVSLSIIAVGVVVAMLQLAQEVIIPFVVSGLLFYALDPIVDWMQRWRLPRAHRRRARPARRRSAASAPAPTRCRAT